MLQQQYSCLQETTMYLECAEGNFWCRWRMNWREKILCSTWTSKQGWICTGEKFDGILGCWKQDYGVQDPEMNEQDKEQNYNPRHQNRIWTLQGPAWKNLKGNLLRAQEQPIPMYRKSSKHGRALVWINRDPDWAQMQKGSTQQVEARTGYLAVLQRHCPPT